jgi:prepilin-type N-terminal cleavage/methylation domain-containing protein
MLVNKKGFNLIEVSVTIVMLALIVVGILVIFEQGFYIRRKSKEKSTSYSLGRQILEEYFNWTALDELDGVINGTVTNGTYNLSSTVIDNVTYNSTLDISDGPVYPTQLKEVKANIFWNRGNFTVPTLKADY